VVVKMAEWILCQDRLPQAGEEVWIHDMEEGVILGTYSRYGWFDVYGEDDGMRDSKLYEVTHWMPLAQPDPPVVVEVVVGGGRYGKPAPQGK